RLVASDASARPQLPRDRGKRQAEPTPGMARHRSGAAARSRQYRLRRRQSRRLDVPLPCHRPSGDRDDGDPARDLNRKRRAPMLTRRALLASASALAIAGPAAAAPTAVTLYKNPECGCCEGYADYLRQNGFTVTSKPPPDLAEISRKAGIPSEMQGCHTSMIGDYVVDGHVPVEAIQKLLAERPAIKGLTLPGMPEGSPGMAGAKTQPLA